MSGWMQAPASEGEQAMMRRILGWIVAWTALAFSGSVLGENYPSRPVTLIVPYAAGGGVDAVARVIAESLSERLGQRFFIENVTGAGGVIGTQRAARAQRADQCSEDVPTGNAQHRRACLAVRRV